MKRSRIDESNFLHAYSYAQRVSDWRSWFAAADELQRSAELIRPEVDAWWKRAFGLHKSDEPAGNHFRNSCHNVAMMLMAFACENICKGWLIREHRVEIAPHIVSASGLPARLKTHSIRKLISEVGMSLYETEQELVHRMTRASTWSGRYQVAARYDDSIHELRLDDGTVMTAEALGGCDMERMDALIARLRIHVGAERTYHGLLGAAP